MIGRLREMAERYPVIGDVRGRGAMLAIELVQPGTTTPNARAAAAVNTACHAEGVLTLTCGTFGNVFRFLPPLVIEDPLVNEALTCSTRRSPTLPDRRRPRTRWCWLACTLGRAGTLPPPASGEAPGPPRH